MTSSSSIHLKALLRKNWILWKRTWCCSLCELLFPIIFILLYKIVRNLTPVETVPERTFYQQPYIFNSTPSIDALPFIKNCSKIGPYVIGLAPQGDSIIESLKTSLDSKSNQF